MVKNLPNLINIHSHSRLVELSWSVTNWNSCFIGNLIYVSVINVAEKLNVLTDVESSKAKNVHLVTECLNCKEIECKYAVILNTH